MTTSQKALGVVFHSGLLLLAALIAVSLPVIGLIAAFPIAAHSLEFFANVRD
jgi:uncharacterized membrane protein